jgi:hypothetical protein
MRWRRSRIGAKRRTELPHRLAGASERGLPRAALHLDGIDDGANGSSAAAAVGTCAACVGDLLGGRCAGDDEVGDRLTGHAGAEADEHQSPRTDMVGEIADRRSVTRVHRSRMLGLARGESMTGRQAVDRCIRNWGERDSYWCICSRMH